MKRLIDLNELADYRVTDGPDPRGWTVVSSDATEVATVTTLLIDMKQEKARYFVVQIGTGNVLLPTAFARLDPDRKWVIYDTASAEVIRSLPYRDSMLTDEQAQELDDAIAGTRIEPVEGGDSADRRAAPRRDA